MAYDLTNLSNHQMTIQGHYGGQEIDNVFSMSIITNGTTVFPVVNGSTSLLSKFESLWATNMCPLLSNGYAVDHYLLKQYIEPVGGETHYLFSNADILEGDVLDIGGGGAASLDSFTSASVWLRTALVGRTRKGRKAIGPLPESFTKDTASDGNQLTDARKLDILAGMSFFYPNFLVGAGVTGYRVRMAVASLKNYRLGSLDWNLSTTSILVRQNVGSQLSRKAKLSGMA